MNNALRANEAYLPLLGIAIAGLIIGAAFIILSAAASIQDRQAPAMPEGAAISYQGYPIDSVLPPDFRQTCRHRRRSIAAAVPCLMKA